MGSLFVAILILIVVISLFYSKTDADGKEKKEKELLARLLARYRDALAANDKATARKYGRDYYAYLRNSRELSAEDEAALEHDIAKLKEERPL